jgi:hypothetical protein
MALLAATGCSSAVSQPDGNTNVDAGSTPDAGGSSDAGLVPDSGPPAAHRSFPPMPHTGNKLLSSMTLVTLVASNDGDLTTLFQFSDDLIGGSWFSAATAEYGVAPVAQSIHVTGPAITANMTNAQLIAYIQNATTTAAPPNGNTLYLLYLPAGIQVTGAFFCAYHEPYPSLATTEGDGWAVVTRCTPYKGGEMALEAVTRVASHEIAEAATDPAGATYTFGVTPAQPWTESVWRSYEQEGHVEVGDLCEGTRIIIPSGDGGWDFQRIWSNDSATDGGDPCSPPQAEPYFNVSVPQDWYAGTSGGTVTIPLAGWSIGSRGNWLLDTHLINGSSVFLAQTSSFWATGSQLGAITLGTACFAYTGMNNGVSGTLTVNIPSAAAAGDWAVLSIDSFEEDPSTWYAPVDRDDYHFWLVGVYLP